jgi:hypothetical protein
VTDEDPVGANEYLLDEQAHDTLAIFVCSALGRIVQSREKAFEILSEGQVQLAIDFPRVEALELRAQARFLVPQLRHPRA